MTRVEELIRDYERAFKKIGNSESWRAAVLLYSAVLVCGATFLLSGFTVGTAHTLCVAVCVVALIAFLGYCAAAAAIIFKRGTLNRGNGERKLVALLQLLEQYRVDWRDKEAVRKLIVEAESAKNLVRLDLTLLPRLACLVALPCLAVLIGVIRSAPVPDLMLDILGQGLVVLEIGLAVLGMVLVFVFLEWLAGCLARQYRDQASRYGIFSQQARQLLMFEQAYLEGLLQAAQEAGEQKDTEPVA